MEKYRGLVTQGGGILGIAHLGVATILKEYGIYQQIKYFAGSSVGAIMSGLFACRIDPQRIEKLLFKTKIGFFDLSPLISILSNITKPFTSFEKNFGYANSIELKLFYQILLKIFIGDPHITFAQVYERYDSFLIVTATDIGQQSTVYYSPDTSPEMSIAEAVRRSAAAPPVFSPISENGHLYADGGLTDNYPIEKLYEYLRPEEVFGVRLIPNKYPSIPNTVPSNFHQYMNTISEMMVRNLMNLGCYENSILVNTGDISPMNFKISREEKLFLFRQGQSAAIEFFENS